MASPATVWRFQISLTGPEEPATFQMDSSGCHDAPQALDCLTEIRPNMKLRKL